MTDNVLTSALFSGNIRLQGCAVRDSDHVKVGDKGPHVHLIHYYLFAFGAIKEYIATVESAFQGIEMVFMTDDWNQQEYSTETESVVRFYKQKRGIINPKYQHAADGIVGIMTIREMDTAAGKTTVTADQRSQNAASAPAGAKSLIMAGPHVASRMLARKRR